MAVPLIRLVPSALAVEPGAVATAILTVTNTSEIVEGYRIAVVDDGASPNGVSAWTQLQADAAGPGGAGGAPAGTEASAVSGRLEVSIYPGEARTVTLLLRPPAQGSRGGRYPFGVHVSSVVNPADSDLVEGQVDVGAIVGVQARMVPVTSRGRWRGRHTVTLSNWGNTPTSLHLVGADPDEAVACLVRPERLDLAAGASATVRVLVRTRAPRLRGQPQRLPFTVRGEPVVGGAPAPDPRYHGLPDPSRPSVDGAFVQKPILSRGLVSLAVLGVAAIVAAVALTVTRPRTDPTVFDAGVPGTPTLAATTGGPGQVSLTWPAVPGVTGYKMLRLAPNSTAVDKADDLDAALGAFMAEGLTPGTRVCFELVARRQDVSSPPSKPACAVSGTDAAQTSTRATGSPTSSPSTSVKPSPSASTTRPTVTIPTRGPTLTTIAPRG